MKLPSSQPCQRLNLGLWRIDREQATINVHHLNDAIRVDYMGPGITISGSVRILMLHTLNELIIFGHIQFKGKF